VSDPAARSEVASILRAARAASRREDAAQLEWLFCRLPHHPRLRRRVVQSRLRQGAVDWASTLLAQAKARHEEDWMIPLLCARCLLERGETSGAEMELSAFLHRRPSDTRALRLAALAADAQRDAARAAHWRRRLLVELPHDRAERERLVNGLLTLAQVNLALHYAAPLMGQDKALDARLLHAQGRTREAMDLLDRADERDWKAMDEKMKILADTGDHTGLRKAVAATENVRELACQRVLALLSVGDLPEAALAARRLLAVPGLSRPGLLLLSIIGAVLGRERLAKRSLARLGGWTNLVLAVEAWRRAAAGSILASARTVLAAGRDEPTAVLPALSRTLIRLTSGDHGAPRPLARGGSLGRLPGAGSSATGPLSIEQAQGLLRAAA